jgi:restriction endonuclease
MEATRRQTWQEFEGVVERLERKFHSNAIVKRDDHLPGRKSQRMRQIDVSIKYTLGPNNVLIVVECKRHSRKLGPDEIGAFISKIDDVGAQLGIIVAEKGFTKGARNLAQERGVKTYTLRDTRRESWPDQVTIKMFVESCFIRVRGWDIRHDDGSTVEWSPGATLRLFDADTEKEITMNDFLRNVWRSEGRREGEFNLAFQYFSRPASGEESQKYRLQFSFEAEVQRFARDATLELLGLTDAVDGTTHTDAFKVVTQPGKGAVYYTEPDFWQKLRTSFGVVIESSHVLWPDQATDQKVLAQQRLVSALPHLQVEVSAQAGAIPLSLNLYTS